MADIIERQIGGLTVRLDRHLCVGFGDCIDEAPSVFVFDGEGIAAFQPDAGEAAVRAELLRACEVCPVDAISLHTSSGESVIS
jgi:ferredoxin